MNKILQLLMLVFFAVIVNKAQAQVSVTATAGTTGPTPYTTLKGAFDAINAGTHQGAIVISITANTTETGPATLNSSGAGSATYTSVLIRPTSDAVSVSGATTTGLGLIQLKGADNVTIDGDNPNTAGTNRDLSIINIAANTITYTSCIRIANAATVVTSSDNIIIKNCIITGSASGRNTGTATSVTGSENTTFGIYAGGNGGATATDAPTTIANVTTNTAPAGTTINNLLINNNAVSSCARAIIFNGANATVSTGVTVSNNVVGSAGTLTGNAPFTSPATTVYTKGIWVNGTTAVNVSSNTIQNILSYVNILVTGIELPAAIGAGSIIISGNTITGMAINTNPTSNCVKGIWVANAGAPYTISSNIISNIQSFASSGSNINAAIDVNTTAASGTIELNRITGIYNLNTGTWGAIGINIAGGNNVSVQNNFVSDIRMDMTSGSAFGIQYCSYGIRINGGTGHKIYYNSVHLTGALFGTANTDISTAALAINATARTGMDIRNNIFSNVITGGTTNIAHVCVLLPSGGTSAMALTMNNNLYYSGTNAATQGIAQVGTTAGTGFYLASDFAAASVTPAANLRAYTSTLNVAATNDDAAKASTVAAPFISSTNLNIDLTRGAAKHLDNRGAVVSVTTDINGGARSLTTPDIGSIEFMSVVSLPVTFTSFTGFKESDANKLTWTTAAEFNNKGFEVQRSIDGIQFAALSFINSKNNGSSNTLQSYDYTDRHPATADNYYRLKQVDIDGNADYSKIIIIRNAGTGNNGLMTLYPNPATTHVTLVINVNTAKPANIIITDVSGRIVFHQTYSLSIGENKPVIKLNTLGKGSYLLQVTDEQGSVIGMQRFIKG